MNEIQKKIRSWTLEPVYNCTSMLSMEEIWGNRKFSNFVCVSVCVHFWVVLPCSDSFSVVSVLIYFYHAKHVLEVNAIQQTIHGIYIKTAQLSIHMTNGLFEAADEHTNTLIYWNCCIFFCLLLNDINAFK